MTAPPSSLSHAPSAEALRGLSGPVGRLAAMGHVGAALKLIDAYGGTRVYVPRQVGGNLLELIGRDALAALIAICGDETGWRRVPPRSQLVALKKSAILAELQAGRGAAEIARKLGVQDGYVAQVRRAAGGDFAPPPKKIKGDTPDLFDDYLAQLPPSH